MFNRLLNFVSAGGPVLRTLLKPLPLFKSVYSWNCGFKFYFLKTSIFLQSNFLLILLKSGVFKKKKNKYLSTGWFWGTSQFVAVMSMNIGIFEYSNIQIFEQNGSWILFVFAFVPFPQYKYIWIFICRYLDNRIYLNIHV